MTKQAIAVLLGQAQAARVGGRVLQAVKLLMAALKKHRAAPELWTALGGARLEAGDAQGAIAALQQAVQLAPRWAPAWCQLAGTLQTAGRLEHAVAAARTAWRLDDARCEHGLTLAHALLAARDAEAAAFTLTLTARFPDRPETWLVRLECLQNQKQWIAAEQTVRTALARLPNEASLYIAAGELMLRLDRPVEAEAVLAHALKIKPELQGAAILHARSLKALRRNEAAIAVLQALRDKAPEDPAVALEMARLLRAIERIRQAEQVLLDMGAGDGKDLQAAIELVLTWLDKGDVERALSLGEQLLAGHPALHDLRMQMAWAHLKRGETAAVLSPATEIPADAVQARVGLGVAQTWALLLDEKREEAWRSFQALPAVAGFNRQENASPQPAMTLLLPVGRSGSLFLHSLFDGHPQLLTLPGIYFKGFFGAEAWSKLHSGTQAADWRERLVQRFMYYYMAFFDASRPNPVFGNPMSNPLNLGRNTGLAGLGENRDSVFRVDEPLFAQCLVAELRDCPDIGPGEFLVRVHRAYARVCKQNPEGRGIFYHIHNPDPFELAHCLQSYPHARLVYLVREPVQSLESWFRVCWPDNPAAPPEIVVKAWSTMATMLAVMLETYRAPSAEHYPAIAVRLEDVKRAPQQTLEALCRFLDIEWHPALMESTFMGMTYWGPESKLSPNIRGFDAQSVERKVGVIFSERDAEILRTIFYPMSVRYGYRAPDADGFHEDLNRLEPLLNEPFDFERRLYERVGEGYGVALHDLLPFQAMRAQTKSWWAKLRSGIAFEHIVPPLEAGIANE